MRMAAPCTLLLLSACTADDPKEEVVDVVEVVHIGVDIDVAWVTQPAALYELLAVVTVSRVEVPANPGGEVIDEEPLDEEPVDGCTLKTFDPSTAEHEPYSDVEALDVGPSVLLTVGDTRVELPAVDDTGGRYYVLATDSDTVSLPFPAAVGVELSGDGESGIAATTLADAAWIPEPFAWTGPPALASGLDPEIAVTEDIVLAWEGAPSGDDPGFGVWVNNSGSTAATGEFWEQLSCDLADDGVYTVTAAEQGALQIDEDAPLRTVQLERYAADTALPLGDGFIGSYFASQIRRADYVPVAD